MSSLSGLIWRPSAILPDPIASLARGGWEEIAGRASRARRSPRNERGERLEREERRTADGAPTFDLCRGRRTDAACAVRRGVARALGLALCSTRGSSYEKREEKKPRRGRVFVVFVARSRRAASAQCRAKTGYFCDPGNSVVRGSRTVKTIACRRDIHFRTERQSHFRLAGESQKFPEKGTSTRRDQRSAGFRRATSETVMERW